MLYGLSSYKLFVGSLAVGTTQDDIFDVASQYVSGDDLLEIHVMAEKTTSKSGDICAFITVRTRAAAQQIFLLMHAELIGKHAPKACSVRMTRGIYDEEAMAALPASEWQWQRTKRTQDGDLCACKP